MRKELSNRMRCVVNVSGHYNLQYVVGTAHIVCGAGSMKRYGVRTSVCTSRCTQQQTRCCRFAAVGCCGPGGQEISIDCCTAGAQPEAACGGRMRAVPLCPSTTGVARGVRAAHRAALASGGKRAKIVIKNSRENSDCIISYVSACNKNTALQLQRVPILSILGYDIDLYFK